MAPVKERFEKLSRHLVENLTGFKPDDENFMLSLEYVLSTFYYNKFLDVNRKQLDTTIQGLCDKFLIHSQKDKANAFLSLTRTFLESEIFKTHPQVDVQYSILAVLLSLANSPTELKYRAPTNQTSVENEEERIKSDWAKILCDKPDETEFTSSDEFSEWSDSDIEVSNLKETSSQKIETLIKEPDKKIENITSVNGKSCSELGRSWLKKNVMPHYWTGTSVIREPRHEHYCNQLYRHWENYLEESGIILGKNSSLLVTEYQISREVLWILSGVNGSFLYTDKQDDHQICLSHLTDKSLHLLLTKVKHYGNIISKLQDFIDSTCGLSDCKDKCQTLQAYATALSQFLILIKNDVFELEKQVLAQDSICSLSFILKKLSYHFEQLDFIDEIHCEGIKTTNKTYQWQRTTKLLNVIYEKLMIAESLGTKFNHIVDLMLNIFLSTFKPFINMMDIWISEGNLQDKYDEFILQRHDEIDMWDEEFWNGAITIREDSVNNDTPLLPDQVRHYLLQAGKSMQMLNRLGKINAQTLNTQGTTGSFYEEFIQLLQMELRGEEAEKKETNCKTCFSSGQQNSSDKKSDEMLEQLRLIGDYDPLLMINFRRMRQKLQTPPTLDMDMKFLHSFKAPFRCPLSQGIQNALSCFIFKKYVHNCSCLINVLKRDFCLFNYLSMMRKYFLMEAGDIMFNFYSQVFDKILCGQSWQDEFLLTVMLQDAIAAQDVQSSSRMSVAIERVPSRLHQPIELATSIRLQCKIPWPINIVITSRMQRMYNQIFTFLLQVKWAKYSLDELRFHNLENSRNNLCNSKGKHYLISRMYLLRMRLLHFVNNIHTYIMTQSLHTTGLELEQRLDYVSDLEQVVHSHSIYIDQLYQSFLLDDQMAVIRQAILWVLNLAITFRSKWDSGIKNCIEKEITEMEEEFNQCCQFLKSFHGQTTRRGSFVEWLYNFVLNY